MSAAAPATMTDIDALAGLVELGGRDVADVGCGPGVLARQLAAHGARVTALEISEDQLAAARATGSGDGVHYAVGRGEALPLANGSQDVVVFLRSLHHVPVDAMGTALREARRVLRPLGVVYVAEPVPEGDFFAMVSIVEDETEARDAARAAVDDAAAVGLEPAGTTTYAVATELAGLDALRARMVAVDPWREVRFDAHREALGRAFKEGGEPLPAGGRRFRQPMRADLLHPFF